MDTHERQDETVTSGSTRDSTKTFSSAQPSNDFQSQPVAKETERSIEEIIFCIWRLEHLMYQTAHAAGTRGDETFFGPNDIVLIQYGDNSKALAYRGYVSQDREFRWSIRRLSWDSKLEYITKSEITPDYARPFLDQCLEDLHRERVRVHLNPEESRQIEIYLIRVHRVILELKASVVHAFQERHIEANDILHKLLSGLQERFPELCRSLGKPEVQLAWDHEEWWKPPPEASSSSSIPRGTPGAGSGRAGGTGGGASYQIPGVFQGPVYFGNVEQRGPSNPAAREPDQRASEYQNTANFSGPNNRGVQIGQQYNFGDGRSPPGA